MDYKQLYNKYYSRMVREGILKAALCGLAVGFGICGIVAFGMWFSDVDGLWLTLGVLVACFAAATPLFYFFVFKPNEKSVARKLDKEGLDERIVTMQELQNDNSDMAVMQRGDAASTVSNAEENAKKSGGKFMRFKVATSIIVAASIIGGFGVGFAIVTGLSDFGIIPNGLEAFGAMFPGSIPSYNVNYGLRGGSAELTGTGSQRVKEGGDTETVLYTGERYNYFVQWVDGNGTVYNDGPSRNETNVTENIKMTAVFGQIGEISPDTDISRFIKTTGFGSNGASDNHIDQNDNIFDGNTPYGDNFDSYYGDMLEHLANNPDLSAEERAAIESYFGFLMTGADGGSGNNP